MPGAFHGIDIAARALRAFQRAIDVTGHNIANVNTRGYSRQTIDLSTDMALGFRTLTGMQQLGSGVSIASVNRIRDVFLDARMRETSGDIGRFSMLAQNLDSIGSIYGEPGTNGISSAINKFFDSWSGLASNPNDVAARLNVQQAGSTLASRIRGAYHNLQAQANQIGSQISGTIAEINNIGKQIAELNAQIRSSMGAGGSPNDLLDQRDQLVANLSNLTGVHTETFQDGTLTVYIGSFVLVDGGGDRNFPSTYDSTTMTVTDGTNSYPVRSGELAGNMQSLNAVRAQMANLDALANTLRSEVNAMHTSGINPNGTTNVNFFNDVTPPALQTGAIDFDLSAEVKADTKNISAGTSSRAGDGGLALAMSQMRDTRWTILHGMTFSGYQQFNASQVGQQANSFKQDLETHELVAAQIDRQQQSVSGVSLDDEMANMLRFQRSYQAAAKALTVMDQVTEDLIGLLRR